MPVNSRHPDYERMVDRWQRCRIAADGQDAVHAAGEAYLPKLKEQTPEDYKAYVMRATFFNATWRTISGLKGMLFRKPPKVEAPGAAKEMLDDVTMSGVPVQQFLEETCEETLKVGRVGILVDYPTAQVDLMTMADAQAANLRPMMQTYIAEAVINWRIGRVNNVSVLTMVVLEECDLVAVDEFKAKEEKRWRVLDLVGGNYRVRMFMMDKDNNEVQIGGDVYPLMNNKPMDFIPFTFIGPDDSTPQVDEPPLIDLVNVNLSHYRSTADLEHGAHFTGLPTPWVAGVVLEKTTDKLYIGSQAAWVFKNPEAKAEYLEFKGEGLKSLESLCASKEKQMAVLGARMLEPQKKAAETSDSQAQNRKGEESSLACAAQSISLGFKKALEWFSAWAGSDGEVEVALNRDFYPQAMTSQMLTALVSALQMGSISPETFFENLQRGEIIAQDRTFEEEQAALKEAEPAAPDGTEEPLPGAANDESKDKKDKKERTTEITTPKGDVYKVKHS